MVKLKIHNLTRNKYFGLKYEIRISLNVQKQLDKVNFQYVIRINFFF